MKLHFLCPRHRQWLTDNPHRALNSWLQTHDQARDLFAEGHWNSALAHAGCALETSEIVLQAWPHPPVRIINRYADNGALLTQLLRERGDHAAARAVIAHCIARLETRLLANCARPDALRSYERLLRLTDTLDAGYAGEDPARVRQPRASSHVH